jgi:putative toxin-antitoxin system antitoxin component (TIGR02293 family)
MKALEQADLVALAERMLGSRELVLDWLRTPAIGLGRRKPRDMMEAAAGRRAVETLLRQIEHGVYV